MNKIRVTFNVGKDDALLLMTLHCVLTNDMDNITTMSHFPELFERIVDVGRGLLPEIRDGWGESISPYSEAVIKAAEEFDAQKR